jgi:hypothetical protein
MAKRRKQQDTETPYLAAALFCEKVLTETDNVLSAIRVVDTVNLTPFPDRPAAGMIIPLPITLLVMIKTGNAQGEQEILLRVVPPSGKGEEVGKWQFVLTSPPESGVAFKVPVSLRWEGEGVYWVELSRGDTLFARAPLRVNLLQPEAPAEGPSS